MTSGREDLDDLSAHPDLVPGGLAELVGAVAVAVASGVAELPPLVLLTGDAPIANIQAEYFQNLFARTLGIEIRIDKQIFKQRLEKMTSGDFDMVAAGWGPDFADPLTYGDLYASWNGNNRGKYNNPALDEQVRIAQSSLDPRTRMDAFGPPCTGHGERSKWRSALPRANASMTSAKCKKTATGRGRNPES